MEFVAMSGKPIVAVMDIKNLLPGMFSAASAKELLSQSHEQWPQFVNNPDPPPWYTACRSGSDFFVRPQSLLDFQSLGQVHHALWQGIIRFFDNVRSLPAESEALQRQALKDYKRHHRENSPGLPLMHRTFGETWTSTFMDDHLFA
jgi:hypothetical protein